MKVDNFKYMNNREIICPYCDHKFNSDNSHEVIKHYSQGEDIQTECENCGEEFICIFEIELDYSTFKKESEVGDET